MSQPAANDAMSRADALRRSAETAWADRRLDDAFDAAWTALDIDGARKSKSLLVGLLRFNPGQLAAQRRAGFLKLLTDPEVEPDSIAAAGWLLVLRAHSLADPQAPAEDATLCEAFAEDALVLELLRQAPVAPPIAERQLSRLRRWLLLSRRSAHYPALTAALIAQAALNGGAWPFDSDERDELALASGAPMRAAYLPSRPNARARIDAEDAVTRAVTAQYEGWPYPSWTRLTRTDPRRLPDAIRAYDPVLAAALPDEGRILVAGCGTGRQAAMVALTFPTAAVTAIDVSEASLDDARRKCAGYGIGNITFHRLDLHDAAALGQRFDAIYCTGVLHHLPQPERGWRALVDVLAPNGFMKMMIYSRIARLQVDGARRLFADLIGKPVSDDLIRAARRRLLDRLDHPLAATVAKSRDFATLAGAHDLLLHRHEDPFGLDRIEQALDTLGLRPLAFDLTPPPLKAAYDAMFPHDTAHRDIGSLIRFELSPKGARIGHYNFTCCRSEAGRGVKPAA